MADAPLVERLAGEWEVARFTGNIPHPYPAGGAISWIRETWAEGAAGQKLVAAIERRQDRVFLGCIELDLTPGGPCRHAGLLGRPALLGSGLHRRGG